MKHPLLIAALLLASLTAIRAADIELTETLPLPECHSIGWVRANTQVKGQKNWDGVLDEAKWGTSSPQQAVEHSVPIIFSRTDHPSFS